MKKQGIKFYRTPGAVLKAQLEAWDKVSQKKAAESGVFRRVMESQRAFAARAFPWQRDYLVDYDLAYDFYFNKS
jgi:TRAP-type mannitol/chloroaromatic compound transport system substrate-binding protein